MFPNGLVQPPSRNIIFIQWIAHVRFGRRLYLVLSLNGKVQMGLNSTHQFTIGVETFCTLVPWICSQGSSGTGRVSRGPGTPFPWRNGKGEISRPQSGNFGGNSKAPCFWGNFRGVRTSYPLQGCLVICRGFLGFFSTINYLIFLVFSDEQRGSCDQMSKLIGGWPLARSWVEVFFASSNIKDSPI